jgi:sulfate permease, SulP family
MLGVAVASRRTPVQLWEVARGAPSADLRVAGVSVFVAASILIARRFAHRFPAPLILVVGMIAASAWLDLAGRGFAVIGPVPGGLPSLTWPNVTWSETLALLPVAASCFVMIIAQSAATARIYAVEHKERVDENADILGLAAANAAAGLSGAFVVNGSPTQTAMAEGAGARSQVAQLVFAAVVVVVLMFLTGPLQYLPRCVLASIVFTIAVGMVDVQGLRAIRRESGGEFLLALFTAVAVPAIGVEQGILLAIAASLVRHVRHSYRPHAMVLVPGAQERWEPAAPGLETDPGLIVYRFGADLFYANADRFADQVRGLVAGAPEPVRWFVIDCAAVFDIDYTAARTLRDLIDQLTSAKVGLVLARVNAFLRSDLVRHGVAAAVGEERIFETLHEATAAVRSGGRLAGGTKSAFAG